MDRVAFCARTTLFTFTTLIFFPPVFNLIDTTAAPTPSTTNLTLSTSDLSAEITPSSIEGTFAASTPATISVTTNNYTGYTLIFNRGQGTSSPTSLANEHDNEITSISSASDPAEFNANNWGYLPSKLNGEANTKYQPAPTSAGTTLDATTVANNVANDYTIALGVKVDYSMEPGTYQNTFILTAVANPVNYTITYDKNTEDTVTNLPETQTGNTEDHSITISNLIPQRANHEFIGWCTSTPTTTAGVDSCSTTTYQPGNNIDLNQTTINNTTLYAMWSKYYTCSAQYRLQNADGSYPSTYTSAGVVAQDLHNGDTCSYTSTQSATYYTNQSGQTTINGQNATISLDVPRTTYKLTFSNSTYAAVATGTTGNYRWGQSIPIVAKHGAGGDFTSWSATAGVIASSTSMSTTYTMPASTATITPNGQKLYIQNLVSSKCTTTARTVYDSRDNELYAIQKLADGKCWMLENLRLGGTSAITVTASNTNSSGNFTLPASTAISTFNPNVDSAWTNPKINTDIKNSTSTVGGATVKYGNLYNYCAASAGAYCRRDTAGSQGNISYDICPKAWRMPTGTSSGEFAKLYAAYSNNYNNFQSVFRAPLNGCAITGNTYPYGSYGCLYSSTYSYYQTDTATSYAMNIGIYPTSIDVNEKSRSIYGMGVRCLLK